MEKHFYWKMTQQARRFPEIRGFVVFVGFVVLCVCVCGCGFVVFVVLWCCCVCGFGCLATLDLSFIHTTVLQTENQQGPPEAHRELCWRSRGSLAGGLGGRIHVYVGLSPFTVHRKPPPPCLLIGYAPIQNKKFL